MRQMLILFISMFTAFEIQAQEIRRVKITDVAKVIADSRKPFILNMWATWCKPCVEEIPYFLEEVRERNKKGDSIQILLVSLDFKESFPAAIKSFVIKRKFNAPIAWLDETDADYFCPKIDQKWSGVLPATLFINNMAGYRNFIEGAVKKDELKREIKKLFLK